MNIFQKLSLIGKVQGAITEIDKQAETVKEVRIHITNIMTEINALQELSPKLKEVVKAIKKALKK